MSTSEGGRKVTAAVASTGRAVATTSRAVGGALSQARGALSGWWTSLTAPAPAPADDKSVSDAEDVLEITDNRKEDSDTPNPDPPDKSLDETATTLNKIQVI